ncbi:MAG: leucyl aminopeptidase family protein [Chloroflexi bacterium]|nr:MAG: leucyl aminopeptidase family protein [Chloroflexota bacterium]
MKEGRPVRVVLVPQVDAAASVAADVLAVPVMSGAPADQVLMGLDPGAAAFAASGEHRGRLHEVLLLPARAGIASPRVLLYGLGAAAELDGSRLRFAHQEMVRVGREFGHGKIAVLRAGALRLADLGPVIEGCVAGSWDRRGRSTGRHPSVLTDLALVGFGDAPDHVVDTSRRLGEATARAREWQNAPANELGPVRLEAIARELAVKFGLECETLGAEALTAGGYRLLAAVGAASDEEPRLIRLMYRGGATDGPSLALVGKGITFDSGGLSLKSDEAMVKMRGDMGGAAAVMAAIQVVAESRLPINVMAVIATAENLPGRGAQRPGDVWTSASGKTVEVLNTDAEGRLVLADAITYALRSGATHIVDLATLTGDARAALGHAASAAVSNDDRLWAQVAAAGEAAGDRVWRLPIYPDFRELIQSQSADLKNAYYGEAGVITAAMFIGEFVEGRPWVHLDIAGSHWNENQSHRDIPRGPLGAGTRLCYRLAELMAAQSAEGRADAGT